MRIFFIFLFSLFFSTYLLSETYVMPNNSAGTRQCFEVISDFEVELQPKEMLGNFEDSDRLRKWMWQVEYRAYYRGFELGVAKALGQSIDSILSYEELNELIVKHCLESKSSDKFFQIATKVYESSK